ncbi:MAG TPA: FAD-binding protein, partial [Thermoanaerobaculia bacterium]|nr:FAD-binding protein [Thermoanaerobaculia bacterium]
MKLALTAQEGVVTADEPLGPLTTWRIGGPARWFCRVRSEGALASVLAWADSAREPIALLGMGSNVLVSDAGFPGIVVRLEGEFLRVSVEGERLTAGG